MIKLCQWKTSIPDTGLSGILFKQNIFPATAVKPGRNAAEEQQTHRYLYLGEPEVDVHPIIGTDKLDTNFRNDISKIK